MNTLMHLCCAPCANKPIDLLCGEGLTVSGFWYNPNIHPYTEYRVRKNTLVDYAAAIEMELVVVNGYGLRDFVRAVAEDIDGRCRYCYHSRLEAVAQYAVEHGYDSFTTSLLISPYQKHDLIAQIAREMEEKYHVSFLYRDFRPLFREGQERARELGMYLQKYCGCIFSEEERYQKKKKGATRPF